MRPLQWEAMSETDHRPSAAVQKSGIIIAANSSCGLLNQKPHWNHGFASVLSIPKFANKIAAK